MTAADAHGWAGLDRQLAGPLGHDRMSGAARLASGQIAAALQEE